MHLLYKMVVDTYLHPRMVIQILCILQSMEVTSANTISGRRPVLMVTESNFQIYALIK